MTFYELATLKTEIFGAGKAAAGLEAWLTGPEAKGTLLGVFGTDIGRLNEVLILRGFDDAGDMLEERERLARASDPFGCSNHLVGYEVESYRPLDFMRPVETGAFGPVYEIRTYRMKLNGLVPTMEKWQAALPRRADYSPCTVAMYGIDGAPRLTQIWPYPDLAARSAARAQSVKDGAWPPEGGPDWLSPDMVSMVAMPLPFSPLQ